MLVFPPFWPGASATVIEDPVVISALDVSEIAEDLEDVDLDRNVPPIPNEDTPIEDAVSEIPADENFLELGSDSELGMSKTDQEYYSSMAQDSDRPGEAQRRETRNVEARMRLCCRE